MQFINHRRILLITSNTFNSYTGTGITLSNLFGGWPIDRIAIVHNDKYETNNNICRLEYKVSESEKNYVFPISILKRKKSNKKVQNKLDTAKSSSPVKSSKYLMR